jgi:hypothetical protein
MTEVDPKTILAALLTAMLQPWHDSVANPSPAQHTVLQRLLGDYSKTEYGKGYGSGNVDSIETYLGHHTWHHGGRIQVHTYDPDRSRDTRERRQGCHAVHRGPRKTRSL